MAERGCRIRHLRHQVDDELLTHATTTRSSHPHGVVRREPTSRARAPYPEGGNRRDDRRDQRSALDPVLDLPGVVECVPCRASDEGARRPQRRRPPAHVERLVAGSRAECLDRRGTDARHLVTAARSGLAADLVDVAPLAAEDVLDDLRKRPAASPRPFGNSAPSAAAAAASKAVQAARRIAVNRSRAAGFTGFASAAVPLDGIPSSVPLSPLCRSTTSKPSTPFGGRSPRAAGPSASL